MIWPENIYIMILLLSLSNIVILWGRVYILSRSRKLYRTIKLRHKVQELHANIMAKILTHHGYKKNLCSMIGKGHSITSKWCFVKEGSFLSVRPSSTLKG